MPVEERRSQILELARTRGFVRVTDLVADLRVSTMTIRRDLAVLAERGVLDKVHGGGVLRRPADMADEPAALESFRPERGGPEHIPTDRWSPTTHVGIVVPSGHYYFPMIVGGARQVLDAVSVRRALAISGYDPEQDRVLVRELLEAGSTGLLLAPTIPLDETDPSRLDWLFDLEVPVVLVERTVSSAGRDRSVCSVRTDHEFGCARAVTHLARLGHRGVALVTQGSSQTKSRVINGWRDAVRVASLEPDLSPLVTTSPQANRDLWPTNEAIDAVLDQLQAAQVTAALVHSDQTALPLVHHARRRGWRIPEDLSIVAYDNEVAEMADPPLTAVSPPKDWVGRAAAKLLLELVADGAGSSGTRDNFAAGAGGIDTGRAGDPVRRIVAEPELVVRSSTAQPREGLLPPEADVARVP
jgi:DNA-binding LacI/PurR family transcriptional regulator